VWGDRLLWTANDGANYQVCMRTLSDPTVQALTADASDHQDPALSGSLAVWEGRDDIGRDSIFAYTATDGVALITSATGGDMPRLSGDRVAFTGYSKDGHDQVFTWKLGEGSVLTTLTYDTQMHADVGVSGDRVTWRTETNTGQGFVVHTWTPASDVATVPGSRFAQSVDVDGDRIVWLQLDYPATSWKLMAWKAGASAPTTVSANCDSYSDPHVAGDRIVWRGMDQQIDLAVPSAPPLTPVKTTVTKPSVTPGTPGKGKTAKFSATLTPKGAATLVTSKLALYHSETKRVAGKKVTYWRLRYTLTMKGTSKGALTASQKLGYAGKWQAIVTFAGSSAYKKSTSPTRSFTVK
jgi:hypothetical protein